MIDFYLSIFSYSFSGLFGTAGVKDVPPPPPSRRTATTSLSSTVIKQSPTNDQIAPINSKQENVTDETLPSDRSTFERFYFILQYPLYK